MEEDVTAGCTASFIAVISCNFSAEHVSKFTKKAAYVNGAVDGSRNQPLHHRPQIKPRASPLRAAQLFRPGQEDSRARAPLRLGHDLSLGRQTGTSEPACMFVAIRTDWKELARAHTALAIRRPALSCRHSLASPCDLSRDSLIWPKYCRWLAAAFGADDYCVLLRGGRHSRGLVKFWPISHLHCGCYRSGHDIKTRMESNFSGGTRNFRTSIAAR
jgi:hypothetical protein